MRIAMFTDTYKPQINGVVTSIETFRKALEKKGHDVYIFAPSIPNYNKKEKNVYRIKSVQFSAYKEYRIGLPFKWLVDFPLKDKKIDVVHIHSPFSIGMAGLGLAKHYKIRVVGTFHTMFPDYMHYFIKYERLQKIRLMKKLFKKSSWKYLSWFYNKCDTVIAPTDGTMAILKKNGISKRIVVVPTGIETRISNKSKSFLRKKYSFGKEKIILHVGRITKEKNIDFIIDSLKPLLKKRGEYKFVIASDGPHKEKLEEKVKVLGLGESIIFTGYLPENKLKEFYKMSDVFVMASKTETQGIVLLEAAFSHLPIITLNAPVTGNFVQESGVGIVSQKEDFLDNVRKVLRNKRMNEKFSKNYVHVKNTYNTRKCVKAIIEVYESLQNHDQ